MPVILSSIRVLVVDDKTFTCMNAVEILDEAGFDIVDAANADEAIEILERDPAIRLSFIDIHMPVSMNGLKLAAAVRERWPPVRIVVTSGHFNVQAGVFRRTPGLLPSPTNPPKLLMRFGRSSVEPKAYAEVFVLSGAVSKKKFDNPRAERLLFQVSGT